MKKIFLFAAILFSSETMFSQMNPPVFAGNPQEIKNRMGKNISEGKEQYDGINAVFTLMVSGLKEPEHFQNFDERIMKRCNGKILSCSSSPPNGITTITVKGNIELSDIKNFIYEQGNIIVPYSKVEILKYRKDYYIKKE